MTDHLVRLIPSKKNKFLALKNPKKYQLLFLKENLAQ
jgi:hypothetical protein